MAAGSYLHAFRRSHARIRRAQDDELGLRRRRHGGQASHRAAGRPKPLSPAALKVAAQPIVAAYSPIVLAGTVRLVEFALILLVGIAIYVGYVVPIDGFEWHYVRPILGIALLAMFAFQVADIYQVQAFRGYEKQYFRLASAWSVVFLIAIGVDLLRQGRRPVLARVARQLLRRRPDRADRLPRAPCSCWCGDWTREGRLDRRTVVVGADDRGDALIKCARQRSATPTCASSACSTTAATSAHRRRSPATRSSAPSTTWSSSPAAPASIS